MGIIRCLNIFIKQQLQEHDKKWNKALKKKKIKSRRLRKRILSKKKRISNTYNQIGINQLIGLMIWG